jgi:uncharacterized protein YbbC (DUF1343 family)
MCPNSFEWKSEHFDCLCGTSAIREAIVKGIPLKTLKEQWQADMEAFMRTRVKYLIY